MIGRSFEQQALKYFTEQVAVGSYQRIDGVEVFSGLSKFWFWRRRLDRLVKRGVLRKIVTYSFWPSSNGMPAYGLKTENEQI